MFIVTLSVILSLCQAAVRVASGVLSHRAAAIKTRQVGHTLDLQHASNIF
jgi:hypothetical protein